MSSFVTSLFLHVSLLSQESSCSITLEDENAYLLHKEEDLLLQKALLEEQTENDDYFPIPLRNMRQIRIRNLKTLEEMVWEKESETYRKEVETKYNNKRSPSTSNSSNEKEIMKSDEEKLLELGYWPNCEWVTEMPLQFYGVQCSKAELAYLANECRTLVQVQEDEVRCDVPAVTHTDYN